MSFIWGDVRNVDVSRLKPIDVLMGGSPCQSFSFAGKQNGMSTKCEIEVYTLDQYLKLKDQNFEFEGQSYLFWEYMRILTDIRKYNPDVKFLLENVEMLKKWERTLSQAIGVFGVHINSNRVSAQNRARIYWTNIKTKKVGLFGELHSDIPQPKDEGILLKDIIETDVSEKYFLSDKLLEKITFYNKGNGEVANLNKGGECGSVYELNCKMSCLAATDYKQPKQVLIEQNGFVKIDRKGNIKPDQTKASALTIGGHAAGNHSDMDVICVSMVGRKVDENGKRKDNSNIKAIQRLEPNIDGKTNCLTTVQKDNLLIQNYRIRKLTPTEYANLQTIPSWYKWKCSDTQIYRMCGNGWTVKAIQHIVSFL